VARIEISVVERATCVAAHVGDQVVLRLSEHAGAGYTWSLDELPAGIRLVSDRYEHPGGAPPGAASTRTFELLAAAAGRHRIRLVNARPWEADAGGATACEVEIAASEL
jgi:predicted secreted protein